MAFINNKYKNLHTESLGKIFYEHFIIGVWIYSGCLTGTVLIPYLLGDHALLDQLGSLSFDYMLGTLITTAVGIGITLFKRSKIKAHDS